MSETTAPNGNLFSNSIMAGGGLAFFSTEFQAVQEILPIEDGVGTPGLMIIGIFLLFRLQTEFTKIAAITKHTAIRVGDLEKDFQYMRGVQAARVDRENKQ